MLCEELAKTYPGTLRPVSMQAALRGQKQAVSNEANPSDPLRESYGDSELVQSVAVTEREWVDVSSLVPQLEGKEVCGLAWLVRDHCRPG